MNRCKNIIIILILLCSANCPAKESVVEKINSIIDKLTSLTCETQGLGDLIRGRYSNTCIKSDVFTMTKDAFMSIGMSFSAMLVTHMNDKDLFPENCSFKNRADYTNPKIDFSFCRNSKLVAHRAMNSIISIITKVIPTLFTNPKEIWNEISNLFKVDKKDYHSIYNESLGGGGLFADLSIPFTWKITKHNDQLCISVLGITGYSPIGCKFIKEPFPESIYSKFYGYDNKLKNIPEVDKLLKSTNSQIGSCYTKAADASKNLLPITAPIVECAKQMVGKMALGRFAYDFNNSNKKDSITLKGDSILFKFQQNMRRAVMLLLTIYLIFFGFKILLKGEVPEKSELILFLLKFILVIYFSVGINKGGEHFDGITKWLFPLLFNATSEFSNWILNATDNELCVFKPEYYEPSLGYMSTWDALDCRVSHYLGLNNSIDFDLALLAERKKGIWDTITNFSIPPYFLLIPPAYYLGQHWLMELALAFPLMIILVAAFVVNIFVISLIVISILAVLAPIIVPMVLFDYTKSYFESWLRLIISFTFQPMIATVFIMVMFSMFDSSFYEGCLHKHETKYSSSTEKDLHTFTLEVDEKEYLGKSDYDFKKCSHSLGFIINHFIGKFDKIKDIGLSGIITILFNLLSGCIVLYLMYIVLGNLTEFIADLSQSLDLSNMVLKPKQIMDDTLSTMSKAFSAMKKTQGNQSKGNQSNNNEGYDDLLKQVVKRQQLIEQIAVKEASKPQLEEMRQKQSSKKDEEK